MSAEPLAPGLAQTGTAWRRNADDYLSLIGRGRNSVWRTVAGCLLIAATWLGLGIVFYFVSADELRAGSLSKFVVTNLGVLAMLAGLALAVRAIQRRPLLTLVTPHQRFDVRRAWQGCAVIFVIAAGTFAVECALYPGRYTLNADAVRLSVFAPAVLLLTPLQAASEELVFRGYLMQSLRSFTRSPLLIVVISSLAFMVPHLWNPEVAQGVLVLALYVLIAVFFAVITLRDGRLELAIGAHAGINIFIAIVASYPDAALDTPALFMADRFDPVYSLLSLLAGCVVFYWWFFLRRAS
jgi:membrane protease YdiL (CAAX protease family)